MRGAGGLPKQGRSQIRFNPESNRRAVARMARRIIPQRERQPVCRVPLLERQPVELELQLARQRLERQQPGCVARKLVLGMWGGWTFLILCPFALRIFFSPVHELRFLRGLSFSHQAACDRMISE